MGKYRIIMYENGLGEEWYVIQKRYLFFFWKPMGGWIENGVKTYCGFNELDKAVKTMESLIALHREKKLKRIVKSTIINKV